VKVRIKTTVHMPEVPPEVDMEAGTLRDLLARLLAGTPVAREIINERTGEMQLEGLFEVRLNDISHNRLPEGLATEIHDGDTLTLSLILIGGG
jgi:hypothetical protein